MLFKGGKCNKFAQNSFFACQVCAFELELFIKEKTSIISDQLISLTVLK